MAGGLKMLTRSQQIRAGFVLNNLCERHAFVKHYVALAVRMAPPRYKQLFRLRNTFGWILTWLTD